MTREEPVPAEVEMPEQTETEDEEAPAEAASMGTLTLPSNATSIRSDITDNFSCVNKTYGYYADVENDCQIFHVCLPVTYADGRENTFRWSFICPEETIFSQVGVLERILGLVKNLFNIYHRNRSPACVART